jgi:glycosyltransferase involved in cell wall biosynthesis
MSITTVNSMSLDLRQEPSNPMPEPHHVLYLIDTLYSVGAGAEGALLRMVHMLPKQRYRCSVGTFHLANAFPSDQFPCPIREFPIRRGVSLGTLKTAFALANYIRRERVDIVHTFFETADLLGGLVAQLAGCPVVISSRRDMGFKRSSFHRFGYRLINPCFDQVQTVSAAVRQEMIRADALDPERIISIPNGIDVEGVAAANGYHNLAHSFGLEGCSPRIITVGNLRHVKGTDVFLRAAAQVVTHYPDAIFVVVGGLAAQKYSTSIQDLVRELGLESNVRLVDHQARSTVWSLLKACDVFCLLSRSEGMSNALLEAMACGLPSVATAVGGNPEVIDDGRTGYLVASEDHQAAAARILDLLSQPKRAAVMGLEAKQTVAEKFSAKGMVEKVVREYDRLLAAGNEASFSAASAMQELR